MAQDNECLLLAEHVFFNNISPEAGKGRPRSKKITNKATSTPIERKKTSIREPKYSSTLDRSLEMKIFAKTKKTISDLRFEETEWYQKYLTFKEHFQEITEKVKSLGESSLSDDEKQW